MTAPNLIDDFYKKMKDIDLDVYGILGTDDKVHSLGTDSKIIGRVFEILAQPVLEQLAEEHGLIIETPASQTVYPDFVLMDDPMSTEKIAVDIKTTYVTSDRSQIKFTLGAFGSYMRNNTKNIEYKYTDYTKHYVIGFVYTRNGFAQESKVFDFEDRSSIETPYANVKYFIQEKYRISGDKPGSGNTENIGSIKSRDFDDFVNGNSPFTILGEDIYDLYWSNYPKYRSSSKEYTSLPEFLEWLPKQEDKLTLLRPFDLSDVLDRAEKFTFDQSELSPSDL